MKNLQENIHKGIKEILQGNISIHGQNPGSLRRTETKGKEGGKKNKNKTAGGVSEGLVLRDKQKKSLSFLSHCCLAMTDTLLAEPFNAPPPLIIQTTSATTPFVL